MKQASKEPTSAYRFDLADPSNAYIFGFMQADGHHRAGPGQKGSISVEIKAQDVELLYAMQRAVPWRTSVSFRRRTTNFSKDYDSAVLSLCGLEGRMQLLDLGLLTGPKSATISPPAEPFSHRDYLRGLFDADGSVGFTARGTPFLSFATASPVLARFVCAEILDVTGALRTARPNARDGVANVMVTSDPAALLAGWLYRDASISLRRKSDAALAAALWRRPASMRARSAPRRWTAEEDALVLTMPMCEAASQLGRTQLSVNMRRWRLRTGYSS